jgi:hypothetical protein
MTAFKNLLLFSNKIAPELALEFIDLVQAYAAEEHQATVQILATLQLLQETKAMGYTPVATVTQPIANPHQTVQGC